MDQQYPIFTAADKVRSVGRELGCCYRVAMAVEGAYERMHRVGR